MRAALCRRWGEIDDVRIERVKAPRPGAGEVLIDVKASGINSTDVLLVTGRHQTNAQLALPYIPGLETAGVVAECGDGVGHVKPGDRVMGLLPHGGLAEQAVGKASEIFPIPDGMSFAHAGAFAVSYISSHLALHWNARLMAGETLLVLGAAGGVGLAAVQIGKAMGARVIAGASTAEKLAITRQSGADELIDYATENLKERVMDLTGGEGVDVCFDPIGGPLCDSALSALGWGGRILHLGFVGGFQQIPANRLLVKNRSAIGSSGRYFRLRAPDKLRQTAETLLAWYAEGRLRPMVTRNLPLERVCEALKLLAERKVSGKVVVTP
ncbi:MAG: hypothetical protein A3G81_16580 [Betaproteobacteria bacterium RIFCSPLOWO2_12_FULL_65_14]|nr:MAG: hypothetical protein A3G81_16580 [Betaproteobacteria bacterium RIFCSPLOWO2_12_FULL_65_14]